MALAGGRNTDVLERRLMWRSRVDVNLVVRLLQEKEIQDEIGLLESQLAELNRKYTEYKQRTLRAGRKLYADDPDRLKSHKAFMDFAKEMKSTSAREVLRIRGEIEQILLPHQIKRLNELYVQYVGVGAFALAVVRNKLLLSSEQKHFIDKQLTKMRLDKRRLKSSSGLDPFGEFSPGGPPVPTDEKAIEKKTLLSILSRLRKDQRRAFKELCGRPFDFSKKDNARRSVPSG